MGDVLVFTGLALFFIGLGAGIYYVNRLTRKAEALEKTKVVQPYHGTAPIRPDKPDLHQPNHLLHLALSILTVGLWVIPWLLVALSAETANSRQQREYKLAMQQYSADLASYEHHMHRR